MRIRPDPATMKRCASGYDVGKVHTAIAYAVAAPGLKTTPQ
jgi:hypothetical protein